MGDECMEVFNNIEKEIPMMDFMTSKSKFDPLFNKLIFFEMEKIATNFKNEIQSTIKTELEANPTEMAKWTHIMHDVFDELAADQRLRAVRIIDGHLQVFNSKGARMISRMQLMSDTIDICHEAIVLAKSCMEAFENHLLKTEILGFDNNRFPLDKIANQHEMVEHEVTNAGIAMDDLRFAIGVTYFDHQIKLWHNWDWNTLYQSGEKTIQDAIATTVTSKTTKISLLSSWRAFKDQLVNAKGTHMDITQLQAASSKSEASAYN